MAKSKKTNPDEEELLLEGFRKEARKALRDSGLWEQEYNGNEIAAVIATFKAMTLVNVQRVAAIRKGNLFIASLLNDPKHQQKASETLREIRAVIEGTPVLKEKTDLRLN